jgi:biopolymer transport protein ExbB/TolQ
MDIRQGGVLAVAIPLALLVASVVTWAACRWWYGRRLLTAAHRLQKCDKSRLFSQEQTLQARRQIEQLKADLASHQQSAAENQAARRRAAQLEEALHAGERPALADSGRMPLVSAHGFADTQILPD